MNLLRLKYLTSTKSSITGTYIRAIIQPITALALNDKTCVFTIPVIRLVGVFRMVLQKLIQDGSLEIQESLVDSNNTVLKVATMTKDRVVCRRTFSV